MTDRGSMSLDPVTEAFFAGPGELARLTRAFDWETTPLGPVESWTASLRTTVSTLLASRHAMFLWWGPDLIQFYNDALPSEPRHRSPSFRARRARAGMLGRDLADHRRRGRVQSWPAASRPGTRTAWSRSPAATGSHDVYWSYSYSPVRDDDGSVGGVLVTVQETTRRVVLERRARVLQRAGRRNAAAESVDTVSQGAARCLRAAPR